MTACTRRVRVSSLLALFNRLGVCSLFATGERRPGLCHHRISVGCRRQFYRDVDRARGVVDVEGDLDLVARALAGGGPGLGVEGDQELTALDAVVFRYA